MWRWYRLASAFLFLQTIGAFSIVDRMLYGQWLGKPGDKLTQGLNLLAISASVLLVGRGAQRVSSVRMGLIVAVGLAGFALSSTAWSTDPQATMRQGTQYLFLIIGALGIVTNLKGGESMDLLARLCFWSAVISLVLRFILPGDVVGDDGEFRGIFSQKNELGQAMAIGALACLHGLRVGSGGRLRGTVMVVVITIAALASQSATSCLVILVFCGVDVLIFLMMKGGAVRIVAIGLTALLLPAIVLLAVFPDSVFELLGKDPTLTGRTDIWAYVIPDIYEKPWLGWGYAGFWVTSNPAAMEIGEALHWWAPQAHNGLLESLVNVGVVGTAGFIYLLIRDIRLALRCMQTQEKAMAVSCLLCCIGIMIIGITESVLIFCGPWTAVLFITGFSCERALRFAQFQQSLQARRKVLYQIPAQT